jgi:hypothetical protein
METEFQSKGKPKAIPIYTCVDRVKLFASVGISRLFFTH